MIKGLSNEIDYYYDCEFVNLKVLDNSDRDIINQIPHQQPFEFQTEKQ